MSTARSDRDVMLSRLGIIDDAPAEAPPAPERIEGPRLAVVNPAPEAAVALAEPQVEAAPEPVVTIPEPADDDPLDDILSRFGIDDKSARKTPRAEPAIEAEPAPVAKAAPARPVLRTVEPELVDDFDLPEPPATDEPVVLRNPEWVAEPVQPRAPEPAPRPEPLVQRAPEPAPPPKLDPDVQRSLNQAEELEELRRQLRTRNRSAVPSELPGVMPTVDLADAVVTPVIPRKSKRAKGELTKVRLGIWLAVIAASGWMTYTVVKASVEHDQAQARPAAVQTKNAR